MTESVNGSRESRIRFGEACIAVVDITRTPGNTEHFARLMAFARDVLAVCDDLGIEPILDGSLAVLAYTQDSNLVVRDVDFSCAETDFPRLREGLKGRDIYREIRSWHVLQATTRCEIVALRGCTASRL